MLNVKLKYEREMGNKTGLDWAGFYGYFIKKWQSFLFCLFRWNSHDKNVTNRNE